MKGIKIKGLKKEFETNGKLRKLTAIEDIGLTVKPGEFVSIVGPSGCGKTILLKIIGGLIRPTEGEILIEGEIPSKIRKRKSIGFVFQNPSLLPWRTVLENIYLPLEIGNGSVSKKKNILKAKKLLELVGLSDFENALPQQLSGGMQQRVAITRALVFEPPFLLMDEPFGALDELTRNSMDAELLRIWSKLKTTVLFVTHSIEEAVFLSDKAVVLSERPAKVKKVVKIELKRPRSAKIRYSIKFNKIAEDILNQLKSD